MKLIKTLVIIFAFFGMNGQNDFDNEILEQLSTNNIPSMAIGVIKDKQLCWSNGYGFSNISEQRKSTDRTLYTLASITKTITATAVFHLMETGAFQLNDNINEYLPYEIVNPNFPNEQITFKMLLQHRSSLRDNFQIYFDYSVGDHPDTLEDFIYNYLNPDGEYYNVDINFANAAPGANFLYCNTAVALLGYLVEVISGQAFSEYCYTNIFEPLEMNSTRFFLSEIDTNNLAMPYEWNANLQSFQEYGHYGYPDYPDGLLRSTIKDFSNFMIMYLSDGEFNGQQILTSESIELLTPRDAETGHIWFRVDGAMPSGEVAWGHGGQDIGTATFTIFENDRNGAVFLFTNGEYGDFALLSFWDELWDMAYGNEECIQTTTSETSYISDDKLLVYPNPTSGIISIQGSKIKSVEVFDCNSKEIELFKISSNENTIELNIEKYSNGLYILKVTNMDDTITFDRIVKTD